LAWVQEDRSDAHPEADRASNSDSPGNPHGTSNSDGTGNPDRTGNSGDSGFRQPEFNASGFRLPFGLFG
jgi:hypothetical protein